MAKVDSNTATLAYARETVPGTKAAAAWRQLEPNEISTFGASITSTPREPISDKLQRRKGSVTDLDSTAAFGADITVDGLLDWLEAAIFARSANWDVRDLPVAAVVANGFTVGDQFTGAAGTEGAARRAKIRMGGLIWADGFGDAYDGLHLVTAHSAGGNMEITVAGLAASAATGYVSLAGVRLPGKATAAWAWDAGTKRATLTYAAHGLDAARGLHLGQMVHFGSLSSAGGALQNGLTEAALEGRHGFARLVDRTANTLVFDRVDDDLQANVSLVTPANLTDIVFGDFFRNVARSHDDYATFDHTLELAAPGLYDGPPVADGYEYAVGQEIGSLVLTFPLTDKATMTVNFVGQDTEKPVRARQAGAPGAAPRRTAAFNTSADFARLRVSDVDELGLTTDFKSLGLTINPQTSPEKVLNKLGARFINRGNLLVDAEAQVIFSSPRVIEAIRDNETLSLEAIIGNEDGVFAIEIPSLTLGGGGREYPANAAVLINTTAESFEDETFETSIHVSFFPVPIPTD